MHHISGCTPAADPLPSWWWCVNERCHMVSLIRTPSTPSLPSPLAPTYLSAVLSVGVAFEVLHARVQQFEQTPPLFSLLFAGEGQPSLACDLNAADSCSLICPFLLSIVYVITKVLILFTFAQKYRQTGGFLLSSHARLISRKMRICTNNSIISNSQ